jgi:hypothetical protein
MEDHLGWTLLTILAPTIITTAAVTWGVATNVVLNVKQNEIEDLKRQLKTSQTGVLTPQSNSTSTPAIQLQVAPTASASNVSATPPQTPVEAESWIPPSTRPRSISKTTLDELQSKWHTLEDRFAEQDTFLDHYDNAQISWIVKVDLIEFQQESAILRFQSATTNQFAAISLIAVFHKNMKSKLAALRRGDLIKVTGVLRRSGNNLPIYVTEFEFLNGASPIATPSH